MPAQCISVCGHSAVGKKTLIQKLLDNYPAGLRERFGLTGSIGAYGYCDLFRPLAQSLQCQEDNLIHFWQNNNHCWIERLRVQFPCARHRVILLWRPWDVHRQAILARRNPCYQPTIAELKYRWHRDHKDLSNAAASLGVDVEFCIASTDDYQLTSVNPGEE
jgi:hypothetical protein